VACGSHMMGGDSKGRICCIGCELQSHSVCQTENQCGLDGDNDVKDDTELHEQMTKMFESRAYQSELKTGQSNRDGFLEIMGGFEMEKTQRLPFQCHHRLCGANVYVDGGARMTSLYKIITLLYMLFQRERRICGEGKQE